MVVNQCFVISLSLDWSDVRPSTHAGSTRKSVTCPFGECFVRETLERFRLAAAPAKLDRVQHCFSQAIGKVLIEYAPRNPYSTLGVVLRTGLAFLEVVVMH